MCLVAALAALLLLPFLGKAFHMDDTVFLWCAEQIQRHPLDFYGFTANWSDSELPMYSINQNPPLIAYYIALVTGLLGWSELALHAAFLVPAIGVALGTYCLSRNFCNSPVTATVLALITPAFVVSGTNVMAEVTMTCFYIWGAVTWLRGLESGRRSDLALSALLISLSAMTKYFGITMVPLLLVYTCLHDNRPRRWYLFLVAPLVVAGLYQWLTLELYGTNLIAQATQYSVDLGVDGEATRLQRIATGLSFLGGCILVTALLTPLLWGYRGLAIAAAAFVGLSSLLLWSHTSGQGALAFPGLRQWPVVVQYALFLVLGLQTLALCLADFHRARDNKALLLLLWLFGTFLFGSAVNWSTNARVMLPLVPVVGILIVRRLEHREIRLATNNPRLAIALVPVLAVSLLVASADFSWANNQQLAARQFAVELRNYPHRVWFGGHWGFQWYMELYGGLPLQKNSPIQPGDLVIQPLNNSNPIPLNDQDFTLVDEKAMPTCCPVRTMSAISRAGFYSDYWGELPFSVARPEADRFELYIAGRFTDEEEARAYYRYSRAALPTTGAPPEDSQ